MTEQERQFGLTIEKREGYLYARIKALELSLETFVELFDDLAEECRRCECEKILLYRDVPSMPGVGNTFEIVTSMLKLLPGLMVAIVNPYPSNSDLLTFASDLAQTRGYELRVFTDESAALQWLGVS
jgi:hypothetical protein